MIKFKENNIEYAWGTGIYGPCWFTSPEKRLQPGTVRHILNKLFYVNYINSYGRATWVPVEKDKIITKKVIDMSGQHDFEYFDQTERNKWFRENILKEKND